MIQPELNEPDLNQPDLIPPNHATPNAMLIALFADIHANREALTACLDDAAHEGAESYVFLGDLVGYGPDPVWVVERVADLVANGALAIQGNHDAAAIDDKQKLGALARAAIVWTRRQIGPAHREFLKSLPLDLNEDDRLYVHASGYAPEDWIYMLGPRDAFQSFHATAQRLTFCGHTHVPALFNESATSLPHRHVPVDSKAMPLLSHRRWIAVLGSVGQPRDKNPAACYALLDTASNRLTYQRVPYDIDTTARKIMAAGLPEVLAKRIVLGE